VSSARRLYFASTEFELRSPRFLLFNSTAVKTMKMSPSLIQWWKELRAVLPMWAAAMLTLSLSSATDLFGIGRSAWQMFIWLAGSTIVCTIVYTREFQDRTLIWQYLQPVNRMAVLGRKFAVAVVLQAVFCSLFLYVTPIDWESVWFVFGSVGVVLLVSVTSCCLWGILIRNALSAMVVSVVVPLALSMIVTLQLQMIAEKIWMSSPDFDRDAFAGEMLLGALAVYGLVSGCLAVFFWRRLQLTGEANSISKLDVDITSRLIGDKMFRQVPAWFALVRKEFGLLRYMFWITGIFLIAAVLFILVDGALDHMIAAARSGLSSGETLRVDVGIIWWQTVVRAVATGMFVIQLALVPTLCGALAFTEEAYLGNRAWQLCQPVRWFWQCLIKFATGLGMSVLMGLLIPAIVTVIYASVSAGQMTMPDAELGDVTQAITFHFVLFGVAAWCATWSRTSVTTIVKVFLVVLSFVTMTAYLSTIIHTRLSLNWRILAGLLTLLAFAVTFLNFRFPDVPTRRWMGQGALAVTVLVLTLVLFGSG